jgi:ABC-type transport system involved in cytochrome bd biosynthesis fused ATPase/permease subunit
LEVLPGTSLGIYGPAGMGKSTLAELVLGVRRPTSGTVSRDGIPVERLAPEEVYEEAVLLRVGAIVQGRLEDNLVMGAEVSADALWAALAEVELEAAVKGLPEGLNTQLGAAGEPLSESRAVDLQVARALLVSPRLVVVDGLLDGLSPSHRVRLLTCLRHGGATLVVLTEDRALAELCDRSMALRGVR